MGSRLMLLVLMVAVVAHFSEGCPDPSSYGRVCKQYIDQCQTSSECGDGGACCLVAGCGKECVQPDTEPQ
ncbi:WAP-type 'four-disulfide core' domain [Trinorchestia longiramus]|nr:WAP-type 'four-disulfide core' domain [Trinorchestia longiramus]